MTKFQWNSSNLSNHVRKTHKSIIADPQRAVRACAGVAGRVSHGRHSMSQQPIVIIGSGLAGYTVAREFRKLDTETPILIISADHGGFYSKPTLSNALATGTACVYHDLQCGENGRTAQDDDPLSSRVTDIDSVHKTVELENGERLTYSQLVLALGADPIRLPLEGEGQKMSCR